jgi:hypothetical protein
MLLRELLKIYVESYSSILHILQLSLSICLKGKNNSTFLLDLFLLVLLLHVLLYRKVAMLGLFSPFSGLALWVVLCVIQSMLLYIYYFSIVHKVSFHNAGKRIVYYNFEHSNALSAQGYPLTTTLSNCTILLSLPSLPFASWIKSGSPSSIALPTNFHLSASSSDFPGRKSHTRSGMHDPPTKSVSIAALNSSNSPSLKCSLVCTAVTRAH